MANSEEGTEPAPQPGSGALRLIDLRRQMIRKASTLHVRARSLRTRGDVVGAARLEEQAEKLRRAARRSSEGGD